jgi:hypothetical protein
MTYDQQETIIRNGAELAVDLLREKADRNAEDGNPNTAQALRGIANEIREALTMKYPPVEHTFKVMP